MFRQTNVTVKQPERGSFPLDHNGACKESMNSYMSCLREHGFQGNKCRDYSLNYLKCRMEKGLMAEDDFANLGFQKIEKND